eukprot:CAMPEP_0168334318 /NCGR_PEP_ID=MMETSP0213-20121227/10186_1 /TAXON_ID=151035 /ORGANISM="Euplotes harpa, Strain FSP1.4" /LENGTH=115 /DNA_ID=CAMNT_0008338919 /DNA_START=1245 /DNA_END=1593 /DNA_ORIENTATION=-
MTVKNSILTKYMTSLPNATLKSTTPKKKFRSNTKKSQISRIKFILSERRDLDGLREKGFGWVEREGKNGENEIWAEDEVKESELKGRRENKIVMIGGLSSDENLEPNGRKKVVEK